MTSECSWFCPCHFAAASIEAIVHACSTNGTFVRFPDGDDEEELVPMRATTVPVGAEIIFGEDHTAALRRRLTSSQLTWLCWCDRRPVNLARFRLEDTSSQES